VLTIALTEEDDSRWKALLTYYAGGAIKWFISEEDDGRGEVLLTLPG